MCERYVCGPPSVCTDPHERSPHPFYDSDFGRVFYEHNVWPPAHSSSGGGLRVAMEATYSAMEPVAAASLQCLMAACGLPHDAFDYLITCHSSAHPDAPLRHHSRLCALAHLPSRLACALAPSQSSPDMQGEAAIADGLGAARVGQVLRRECGVAPCLPHAERRALALYSIH